MLVVGENMGTNTSKDKATVKHLFAMNASKVSNTTRLLYSDLSYLTVLQEMEHEPLSGLACLHKHTQQRTDPKQVSYLFLLCKGSDSLHSLRQLPSPPKRITPLAVFY